MCIVCSWCWNRDLYSKRLENSIEGSIEGRNRGRNRGLNTGLKTGLNEEVKRGLECKRLED